MKRITITIGREFGCNAREIGRQVAAKLGVKFYDKELVDMAAKLAGVSASYYAGEQENGDIQSSFISEFGYGANKAFFSETAISAQGMVIRKIANTESSVMLGRCSDFFLSEFPNILNVFVYAPLPYRIEHISSAYSLSAAQAQKFIKRIDKSRHKYYKHVTGRNRGDRTGRNLMIDVEMFGIEGAVELILNAIKIRFGELG